MADLQVNYSVLDATRVSLHRIVGELERMDVRRDEMDPLWVGARVRKAMRGFSDDWDRHRRDLISDAHELEEKVTAVADTFRGVESALVGSLVIEAKPLPAGGCS